MARLNLICNGMMLFNEPGDGTVQVIVPDINGHVRKFSSADKPSKAALVDLPIDAYGLTGPATGKASLRSMMAPDHYLFLDRSKVSVDLQAAAKVSAIVTVPMPSLVRLFRASEPSGSVFGGTDVKTAFARPCVHHDVVVFSYVNLSAGTKVSIGAKAGPPLAVATLADTDILNWIVFSTERDPLNMGMSPHSTDALNNLLKVNGKAPDFSLSAIGRKDGPHSTGIGITDLHMSAFHELPAVVAGSRVVADSGDLGCSGAAIGG